MKIIDYFFGKKSWKNKWNMKNIMKVKSNMKHMTEKKWNILHYQNVSKKSVTRIELWEKTLHVKLNESCLKNHVKVNSFS